MRQFWILALCATAFVPMTHASASPKPRLLVFVLADQMSDDLLDRYGPLMRKGFRRLLDGGRRYENAVVDHAPSNSLPGHLSAATGAYPRRHGIIDNSWIEMQSGKPVRVLGFGDPDCVAVEARRALPAPTGSSGVGIGPGRFESPTIVEWVLAADRRAKFASVGTGGGVAALHAGKARGPVLWYSPRTGQYVTSSCYSSELPRWATEFNSRLEAAFMVRDWTLSAPTAMTRLAGPDDTAHENAGNDYVFPHKRPGEQAELWRWFNETPLVDGATLALAQAAVLGENLGQDDVPDILTIGLSTLDHVGHAFGPTSVEQADALFRMDDELGAFFDFLDQRVGNGRWSLAITADHGAPPAPEDAQRLGIGGGSRVSLLEASKATDAIVAAGERHQSPEKRARAAAETAAGMDFTARVIVHEDLAEGGSDAITRLYANSYRQGRVSTHPLYDSDSGRSVAEFGIIVIPKPYVVIDHAASIHGSPFAYDLEVEMIFYGSGVAPATVRDSARTIDLAPSLAKLAGIAPLADIDGSPLNLSN
jgi:hypothetical protein